MWRTPDGKFLKERRHALWEALIISPAARTSLGREHWCERWRELDSNLSYGIGTKLADELISLAGIVRTDQ